MFVYLTNHCIYRVPFQVLENNNFQLESFHQIEGALVNYFLEIYVIL